jgi:SsrA-binding protein
MIIKSNRKALFDFEVLETLEAGIILQGWEVKSIRANNVSLQGSFAFIKKEELWLRGMNIANWPSAPPQTDVVRLRDRKLLVQKKEISKIQNMMSRSKRLTIVPLELLLQKNLIKVKIAVVQSRRKHEKKDVVKRRDMDRDIKNDLKSLR